jgi:hypothetical protein
MASYNLTGKAVAGYTAINDGYTVSYDHRNNIVWRKVDFARLLTKGISGYVQNDLVGVLPVSKGDLVEWACIWVLSPDTDGGANVNVAMGDALTGSIAASATGWLVSSDLKAAAGTIYETTPVATTYLYVNTTGGPTIGKIGKVYSAAGTLDLKILGTTTTLPKDGVILVAACLRNVFPQTAVSYT